MNSPIPYFDSSSPFWDETRALVAAQFHGVTPPALSVHPDDDMYKFGIDFTATRQLANFAYFRAGIQIFDTARDIVEWRFGSFGELDSFCDFAAGYGRSTRFLAAAMDPKRIWSAEVLPLAVEFQGPTFGVNTILSVTNPNDLEVDQRFDAIFVSSLFSHLPEKTFGTWLGRLYDLLSDRGILIFSVHDEAIAPPGTEMPPSGIHFMPLTEVASLDTDDYGATIVTEQFVARTIADATGQPDYKRLPRALCFEQDIYVVSKDDAVDASCDLAPRRGPHGVVDFVEQPSKHTLRLRGWSVDLDDVDQRPRVEAWLGGRRLGDVATSLPRPDVAAHLGSVAPNHVSSGFELTAHLDDAPKPTDLLFVKAVSSTGKEFALQCVTLEHLGTLRSPGEMRDEQLAHGLDMLAHSLRTVGFVGTAKRVPNAVWKRAKGKLG